MVPPDTGIAMSTPDTLRDQVAEVKAAWDSGFADAPVLPRDRELADRILALLGPAIDRAARALVVHAAKGGAQTASAFAAIIRREMGVDS